MKIVMNKYGKKLSKLLDPVQLELNHFNQLDILTILLLIWVMDMSLYSEDYMISLIRNRNLKETLRNLRCFKISKTALFNLRYHKISSLNKVLWLVSILMIVKYLIKIKITYQVLIQVEAITEIEKTSLIICQNQVLKFRNLNS
jgi:hypothetical protein